MKELRNTLSLIGLQHLLHFRWFVNRIYPNLVVNKKFTKMIIINVAVSMFILSFIAGYSIFKIISKNDIHISVQTGEKLFIVYYLLLFVYFVRNSFNEAYIRAFYSKDYRYLRLQKFSPFSLQISKIIDAFFLEIILLILPIHLGITLPFIFVFDLKELWGWMAVFILVIILSLSVRGLFMLSLFLIDSRKGKNRKILLNVLSAFFWLIIGWFLSFSIVQYVLNKEILMSLAENLLDLRLEEPLQKIWLFGGGAALLLIITLLFCLYANQMKIDAFRIGLKGPEKRRNNKIENALYSVKSNRKWVSLFLKDLLLIMRGEYISYGFVKASLVFFSFSLGILSALSVNYLDGKQTGIICLIIIVFQFISNELIIQSISKISSIDQERNWLKFFYPHMNNPYFIYFSKLLLMLMITVSLSLISTVVILLITQVSLPAALLLLLSSVCIPIVMAMSFLAGNACFPNFKWETQDQINTSLPGYITENIFLRVFQVVIISIIGANTAFLFAQKITVQDFIILSLETIIITGFIWVLLLFLILRAPLWKGWKW